MYTIDRPKDFTMELDVDSFEVRLQKLLQTGKKVVYIKNQFDNSTFRYRCFNVVQAMSEQKEYVITYFLSSEIPLISKFLQKIDILILQRAMWDLNIENIISYARNLGIQVVYDVDDLIVNPKYIPLYLNNLGIINKSDISFDVHFNFASKYFSVAEKCDSFIATNKFLAEILEKDFFKSVSIIPNFLNKEQESHSAQIRKKRVLDKSKFVMGYFSGSPSHYKDFSLLIGDIKRFLEEYKDTFLKIVGHIDIPKELREYEDRIIQVPFVSYEELQYEIGEVDVNLVPLQQNLFNNCKSELKYFEAGIVNVISICSPTYVYNQIVRDGLNGYIARDGEWFAKLDFVYQNRNKMSQIAKRAFKTSLDFYGVENQSEKIVDVYNSILLNS
ncbi:MAG TPA: glycosyltransferase [Candidatus Dojkabacteria bacterium]|nr:glycosyltransferase [Methanofastidiosum sp.]HRZ84726.1 glycosyltransferase [Candidatus Dojkabacteria bacterium]